MAQSRLLLHELLEGLMDGAGEVYFQSPGASAMTYPCIVYKRDLANTQFADNGPYRHTKRYSVTIIDQDPDSTIPDKVAQLPMCIFERHYVSANLNHDVYNLYF